MSKEKEEKTEKKNAGKKNDVREYELNFLILQSQTEKLEEARAFVKELIIKEGGEVIDFLEYKKRKLAYEIKHEKYGFHTVLRFVLDLEKLDKLGAIQKSLNLKKEITRHIIVKVEELPPLDKTLFLDSSYKEKIKPEEIGRFINEKKEVKPDFKKETKAELSKENESNEILKTEENEKKIDNDKEKEKKGGEDSKDSTKKVVPENENKQNDKESKKDELSESVQKQEIESEEIKKEETSPVKEKVKKEVKKSHKEERSKKDTAKDLSLDDLDKKLDEILND